MIPYTGDYIEHIDGSINNFKYYTFTPRPLVIKERLGHKDIGITLNTYGHLYPNEQKKLAEMLNEQREKKNTSDKE